MVDRPALAALPRIDALVESAAPLVEQYGRVAATAALRRAVENARQAVLAGGGAVPGAHALISAAEVDLGARGSATPKRVINATGVLVHTNLGRAPLSEAARAAVLEASGYCDLEFDLETGARGSRGTRLDPLIAEAAGAEDALAVNNAAAALVLVLAALAPDREVVVSRGELVEIGGSFRLPEIMAASGARLVEVGTTNRTRASDFATALDRPGADVALLLAVHPSNFRITGFTEAPAIADLADVARAHGVPLAHDTGSGLLGDRAEPWLAGEPSLSGSLRAGADLVLASGDKLLGGPQAGLLAGRADLIDICRRHPLARALRLDKLRIAALGQTLAAHLRGTEDEVPIWASVHANAADLERRAKALADRVSGDVVTRLSLIGGGAAPGRGVPSPVVRIATPNPTVVARRLRTGTPPLIVRVDDGAIWVDLRAVAEEDDQLVTARLLAEVGD